MNQFIRYCIFGLIVTFLAACGGGGDGGTNTNESPSITSDANLSVAENTTAVTTVTASDADGDLPTFYITGGADRTLFAINNLTGVLTYNAAPDFEFPSDAGTNNVYDIQVTANDGNGGTALQNIAITVTDVAGNDAPPGIYAGTITPSGGFAETAVGLITSNGKLMLFGVVTNEAVIGIISEGSINGTLFSASVKTVTGTITSASAPNITGTYDSGTGAFDLDEDQPLYARDASFAKLFGTWVDNVNIVGMGVTTWIFQSDGSYGLQSTFNCYGTGHFYLIDDTKNEYEMDLTITNCPAINGTYTGIGMISDTSYPTHTDDKLTFMFSNGPVGALYEPIK